MEYLAFFLLLICICHIRSDDSIKMMADFHSRDQPGGLLTDYQSDFFANHYSFLSIEKCLGNRETVDGISFMKTTETFYDIAADVASRGTDTKVLFYWNAKICYGDCYVETLPLLNDLTMQLQSDDGSEVIFAGPDTRPYYDMSKQKVRDFWVQTVIKIVSDGLDQGIKIDGVFIDGTCALFSRSQVSEAREDAWNAGTLDAVKELKAALVALDPNLYLLVNGIHFYTESTKCTEMGQYADGMMVEHFGSYEMLDTSNAYQNTYMDVGKLLQLIDITQNMLNDPFNPTDIHVKAWIGPETTPILPSGPSWMNGYTSPNGLSFPTSKAEVATASQELLDYPLAIYLCTLYDDANTYFSYAWRWSIADGYVPCANDPDVSPDSCSSPADWYPQFTNSLGAATSPVAQMWEGTKCRRSFEHATVYVDLSDETSAEIKWGESSFDWDLPLPFTGLPELEPLNDLPHEIIDGIRWIKAYECDEDTGAGNVVSGFGSKAQIANYAKYAIAMKFPPKDEVNGDYDGYAVEAKVCSNPVWNMNNGFELSLTTDEFTTDGTRFGWADLNEWKGTDAAKNRLRNRCGPSKARKMLSSGFWYNGCGYGGSIHLFGNKCRWEWSADKGQDIAIWLGFDINLAASCEDDSSVDQYYYGMKTLRPTEPLSTLPPTQSTLNPTPFPTAPTALPTTMTPAPTTTTTVAPPTVPASLIPELAPLQSLTSETIDGIRWYKMSECAEAAGMGQSTQSYSAGINGVADLRTFVKYAVALKFVPGVAEKANYVGYQVETKVCSDPVWNLNQGFEVSFVVDKTTKKVVGNANLDAWKGSPAAKARLETFCTPLPDPRDLPHFYQSCGNGNGMHLWSSTCQWDWRDDHDQDIEIWFGFDVDLSQYCGDGYGKYVYQF